MENDVIVFIYKREPIEENLGNEKKFVQYILTPVEIAEGTLIEDNDGSKIFYSDEGNYNLKSIEDTTALDEEFLFAFPVMVNEYDRIARDETKSYMKEEDLYKSHLMQHYSNKDGQALITFAYNI